MTDTFTIGTQKFAGDLKLGSQCKKILAHLLEGNTITNNESMLVYHVPRLSDVIMKLRRSGYEITTTMKTDGVGGQYASYRLIGAKH